MRIEFGPGGLYRELPDDFNLLRHAFRDQSEHFPCQGFLRRDAMIEAMACGTAVVCANTSSLPEAAGDAALLFEPTKVAAIVEALGRVLEDERLRATLREKGLAQAKQFSWARAGQETLEIYRTLIQ